MSLAHLSMLLFDGQKLPSICQDINGLARR